MQNNNRISYSTDFGGARTVFTGTKTGITSGRYTIPLDRVPSLPYGCIPAGTPIKLDDSLRTADIHYAFETVAGGSSTETRVKKSLEGTRAWVGMNIMVMPDGVESTGLGVKITAVDSSNEDYDVLTHADLTGSDVAGTVLVEASGADASATIAVLPNAFTFYDLVKEPNSVNMWVDGLFTHTNGVLLTRRVPPIAPAIREYLGDANNGNCYVRYSDSQE